MIGHLFIIKIAQQGENCKKCGIINHFAKVCRMTKYQIEPKPRVNNVSDASSEAAKLGTSATVV